MATKAKPKEQPMPVPQAAEFPQDDFAGAGFDQFRKLREQRQAARERFEAATLRELYVPDGETFELIFLHEEPVSVLYHTVPYITKKGKEMFLKQTCPNRVETSQIPCAFCESQSKDIRRKSMATIWLVLARIEEHAIIGPNGQPSGKWERNKLPGGGTIYVYRAGSTAGQTLLTLSGKKGLTGRVWDIARSGSGQDTAYTFMYSDPIAWSPADKEVIETFSKEVLKVDEITAPACQQWLREYLRPSAYADQQRLLPVSQTQGSTPKALANPADVPPEAQGQPSQRRY